MQHVEEWEFEDQAGQDRVTVMSSCLILGALS